MTGLAAHPSPPSTYLAVATSGSWPSFGLPHGFRALRAAGTCRAMSGAIVGTTKRPRVAAPSKVVVIQAWFDSRAYDQSAYSGLNPLRTNVRFTRLSASGFSGP